MIGGLSGPCLQYQYQYRGGEERRGVIAAVDQDGQVYEIILDLK